MQIRRLFFCVGFFAAVGLLPQTLSAAVIVSFGGPVSIMAGGGSSTIDVFVTSTDGLDHLDVFSAEFLITPVGGASADGVQFSAVQAESQLANIDYVHGSNSAGSPIGNASGVSYIGGDSTLDGLGTLLPENTWKLIFTLDLKTFTALAGEQYKISLVNDVNTLFLDPNFSELTIDNRSFEPANAGTINVISATVVPEPDSVVVFGVSAFVAALVRYRRQTNCLSV